MFQHGGGVHVAFSRPPPYKVQDMSCALVNLSIVYSLNAVKKTSGSVACAVGVWQCRHE